MISNPVRYQSRYRLYNQFKKEMAENGVQLFTVEVQHGNRDFVVTHDGDPHVLQLRTTSEIWHKENAINLGVQRLPKDWKYVCWIDSDISFQRSDWMEETLHQLQIYKYVQMFSHAIDLGPDGAVLQTHNGFMWSYLHGLPFGRAYSHWHPGYAHACTRDAWDGLGGLLDTGIAGAGDHAMCLSLVGQGDLSYPKEVTPGYKEDIQSWQKRAERYVKRDVGYVPGSIFHHFHGSKRKRFYAERWEILIKNKFDPNIDLKRDWQGLYSLVDEKWRLRDDMRKYFRARDEDSTSVD